jgi:hypothetical protein
MNLSGTKLPAIELARIRISNHYRFSQQCFKLRSAAPWPPRLLQFGARLVQFRLEPRSIGMQFGVTISQRLQFIEHDGHVARHADLIRLGVVSLRPRFLQFIAQAIPAVDILAALAGQGLRTIMRRKRHGSMEIIRIYVRRRPVPEQRRV